MGLFINEIETSYNGWLPVDDDPNVGSEDSERIQIENLRRFIEMVDDDESIDDNIVVGDSSGTANAGKHGGVRVGLGGPSIGRNQGC